MSDPSSPATAGGDGGSDAARGVLRLKPVEVNVFGATRNLGTIATSLITDLLAIVRAATKKDARLTLSEERIGKVDAELRARTAYAGVDALRVQLKEWQAEYRGKFDANTHYDARRAKAYTAWNEGSQEMLATRCLELAGLADVAGADGASSFALQSGRQRVAAAKRKREDASAGGDGADAVATPSHTGRFIVDIGCGTGLSTRPALLRGYHVVGFDLAEAMLLAPVHPDLSGRFARNDMREGIPVRAGVADGIISIGALHFLGEDPPAIASFFADVARVLTEGGVFAAQFFPSSDAQARAFTAAATAHGLWATLLTDQPHRTDGKRTFLIARRLPTASSDAAAAPCALYKSGVVCPLSYAHACAARGLHPQPVHYAADTHDHWLWREHLRYAHKLVRTRRFARGVGGGTPAAAAAAAAPAKKRKGGAVLTEEEARLADRLLAVCGEGSLLEAERGVQEKVFEVMHAQ